jgi:hypothetical protein
MSQCGRCKKEINTMLITNKRQFDGGTLVVTDVPVQKCECDEQMLLNDSALIAGYVRLLVDRSIIGEIIVSMQDLKQKFTIQDFLPKEAQQH